MESLLVDKQYYCGIDLHANKMYACVMNRMGVVEFHHELPTDFSVLKKHLEPYLPSLAICAESTFNWYWLSDACLKAGIEFYLGHALYMKLIHGGKTKNDRMDAKILANLLRNGFFPPSYAYPEKMRATRDLLRRRHTYAQQRAETLRHMKTLVYQQGYTDLPSGNDLRVSKLRESFMPYKLPEDTAMSLENDLLTMEFLDEMTSKLEWHINQKAKQHDVHAYALLKTIKGLGPILGLTILYEIHTIDRFKSPQCFSSYSRVVKVERSSNGKSLGSKNNKIGNPYLRWVFGQLAVNAQRFYPSVKEYTLRLIKKHGKARAYTYLAHKYAIVVYYMLKNKTAFDVEKFVAG